MSQPPENSDAQQPDVNTTQQADSSTLQNVVEGNQNRVVQGDENQSVLGDNNTVVQGSNNLMFVIKELILGQQLGKTNKNLFQVGRDVVINATISFFLLLATVFVLSGGAIIIFVKSIFFHDMLSFEKTKVSIGSLIVSENTKYYRIAITTYNPLKRNILVNQIKINRHYNLDRYCNDLGRHYIISDKIYLQKIEKNSRKYYLPLFTNGGELSKYSYYAKGIQNEICGDSSLAFNFDASTVLKANSHTTFLIDIPKKIKISQAPTGFGLKFNKPRNTIETMMKPDFNNNVFDFSIAVIEFKVTAHLTTELGQDVSFVKNFINTDY